MSRGNWVRTILPLGLLSAGLLSAGLLSAGLLSVYAVEVDCKPEKPSADVFEMIFPPDHSMLEAGNFEVICKANGGTLEVDGELIEWQAFKSPLRVARVSLYSGRNTLKIGDQQVEIFVVGDPDDPGGPEGWPLIHKHRISRKKKCGACHETKLEGDLTEVGELKSYKACFECHELVEFEVTHAHPLEPFEHCQRCHSPHGSKEEFLLKAPAKKLCTECHDS